MEEKSLSVKISINTRQYDEKGNMDTIEMTAFGKIFYKNDGIYVIYKEKEENIEITNTIKILKDEVSIKKFGAINSTMLFKCGESSATKYVTPQGTLLIDIDTRELDINIQEGEHIKLKIDYNIKIQDLFLGRNKIDIYIGIK